MSALDFVQMVEKYPCLYNSELPEYGRKEVTDVAWGEVSKEMDWTISECKEKWKNIRNGFVRSLKPYPSGGCKKPYYLHDALQFIVPFINPGIHTRPDKMRVASPLTENADYGSDREEVEATEVHESQWKVKTENCDPFSPEHVEQSFASWVQNRKEDNPRKLFLLSLLPDVQQLTDEQLGVFRIKVLLLLEELKSQSRADSQLILDQYVKLLS